MTGRQITAYVARAALLIAGILIVRRQLAKRAEGIATNEREVAALPESVQASAVYQRFGARRKAVEAMRADLLGLVRAESLFTADSGHPTMFLPPAYWPHSTPGSYFGAVHLTPHGWYASIVYAPSMTVMCAVAVGPDTSLDGAPSGEPVCRNQPRQFDF
jgi:hypothetical protein